MAKAKATCKCIVCGNEYIREKICRNRAEADNWVKWTEEHPGECYECYNKRIKEERKEIASKYNLPEIKGVSEKQINYAKSLRDKYIAGNEKKFDDVANILAMPQEEIQKAAEQQGKTYEEFFTEGLEFLGLLTAHKLTKMSSAREIIDILTR